MEIEPSLPFGFEDTSYQAAGGERGIRKLVNNFYHKVDTVPAAAPLRALHQNDLKAAKDKLSRFLCGWLGGPNRYQERYGSINIPDAHRRFNIGKKHVDIWLLCMDKAIDEQRYSEKFTSYLKEQFRVPAARILEAQKS